MNQATRNEKSTSSLIHIKKLKKENIEIKTLRNGFPTSLKYINTITNKFVNKSTKTSFLSSILNTTEDINIKSIRTKIPNKDEEELFKIKQNDFLTEVEKQSINAINSYGIEIDKNMKELEKNHPLDGCLSKHEILPELRARMVDWMVEVLTNFQCNDPTFFLSISLMDRYLKRSTEKLLSNDIHLIGVTCMFIASKFEDIYPMRMKTIYEKIGHKKLSIEQIKNCESQIMKCLGFLMHVPTTFDFVKTYLRIILNEVSEKDFISKMSIYLAKMNMHDYTFCSIKPSLQAAACIMVSLKLCEQLKKSIAIDSKIMALISAISGYKDEQIVKCYNKILYNSLHFEKLFPGLENLRKKYYSELKKYL